MTERLHDVIAQMRRRGARAVHLKQMAPNDNSKNQVYLGGGEASLRSLGVTFEGARLSTGGKQTALLVDVAAAWLHDGTEYEASSAKLVIYPQYPEVRLSGLARGVPGHVEGRQLFIPRMEGRVLVIGVTDAGWLLWVGLPDPGELDGLPLREQDGSPLLLVQEHPGGHVDVWTRLLREVGELVAGPPVEAVRLTKEGIVPYSAKAPNAPGLTFEALLGVEQNAVSGPDYGDAIELKAFQGRVTLMTPEPTGGVYVDLGKPVFLERFGRVSKGKLRFNGTHKLGVGKPDRPLTLVADGWDPEHPGRYQPEAFLSLRTAAGVDGATWLLRDLHSHWLAKHDQVLFVGYDRDRDTNTIDFKGPVTVGIGTTFGHFMSAMRDGHAFLDPGTSMPVGTTTVHARNQFRVNKGGLPSLYDEYREVAVT